MPKLIKIGSVVLENEHLQYRWFSVKITTNLLRVLGRKILDAGTSPFPKNLLGISEKCLRNPGKISKKNPKTFRSFKILVLEDY